MAANLRAQSGPPWARSPKAGLPPQGFFAHVGAVEELAVWHARQIIAYAPEFAPWMADIAAAARLHDCGKLDPANQHVLGRPGKDPLPVPHEDAGTAWLADEHRLGSAMLVASHHAGLPCIPAERLRHTEIPPGAPFRRKELIGVSERNLPNFREQYASVGLLPLPIKQATVLEGMTARLALSCLVDADHTDSATRGADLDALTAMPRWEERLASLDAYVARLQVGDSARRSARVAFYNACRHGELAGPLLSCEAPVGSGKTTSVMAYLLRLAIASQPVLRHIFVVAPYTNIIHQTVQVYRQALALPDESPDDVVAELHHLADFAKTETRQYASLWTAPIIVTTAVQFFETMAAAATRHLRKFHQLPGSAVFLDEAHACLPAHLWRQTMAWLQQLATRWGCHFVFASGSLTRFWQIPGLTESAPAVVELDAMATRRFAEADRWRVKITREPAPFTIDQLATRTLQLPGPRLVIVNTLNNAARLARALTEKSINVIHLSTALAPKHRKAIVRYIGRRLRHRDDTEWALVATSCVEAGVDFSFRSGIREEASVTSLLQTAGRVNRHAEYADRTSLLSVRIVDDSATENPALRHSRRVLQELFDEGWFDDQDQRSPSIVATEALRREAIWDAELQDAAEVIAAAEAKCDFPEVANTYRVIDAETVAVIVDDRLADSIEAGEPVNARELLLNSVQIWGKGLNRFGATRLRRHPELQRWTLAYDKRGLGIMAGVLDADDGLEHLYII